MADYINNYKNYLIRQGAEFIIDARAISYEELTKTGCTGSGSTCPTYIANGQLFWLGSLYSENNVYYVEAGVYARYINRNDYKSKKGIRHFQINYGNS